MMYRSHKNLYFVVPLAIVLVVLLFVGGPNADSLRSFRYLWGIGHLFCFAIWAYLYVRWRSGRSFYRQLVEVVMLSILLGGATELIQSGIGREASWVDLGNDVVGGIIGVSFCSPARRIVQGWQLNIIKIMVVILVSISVFPVGKVLVDDIVAWQQFPLLAGFETSLETTRWRGSARRALENQISHSGNSSLRVELTTQRYSGIGIKDFPRDWTGFSGVNMWVFNPDIEPLTLHFRIHDHYHYQHDNEYSDRFNTSFDLKSGWNLLHVSLEKVANSPKTRLLDMSRISGMGVFVGKLEKPHVIYLDDVELVP